VIGAWGDSSSPKDSCYPDGSCWARANYVLVDHCDGKTAGLYLHLAHDSVRVSVGQRVATGTVLGNADNTGWSSGPHLHFQVQDLPPGADGTCSGALPPSATSPAGWWFRQSVPITFGDFDVLTKTSSGNLGVPVAGQTYTSSNATESAAATPTPTPTPVPTPSPKPVPVVATGKLHGQEGLWGLVGGPDGPATITVKFSLTGGDVTAKTHVTWREPCPRGIKEGCTGGTVNGSTPIATYTARGTLQGTYAAVNGTMTASGVLEDEYCIRSKCESWRGPEPIVLNARVSSDGKTLTGTIGDITARLTFKIPITRQ